MEKGWNALRRPFRVIIFQIGPEAKLVGFVAAKTNHIARLAPDLTMNVQSAAAVLAAVLTNVKRGSRGRIGRQLDGVEYVAKVIVQFRKHGDFAALEDVPEASWRSSRLRESRRGTNSYSRG